MGIIPARGGSRGVLRKNMRPLGGVPLLKHTAESATAAGVFERLIVSSDDPEILAWARLRGFEVDVRPAHLAGDETTIAEVARDLVERLQWAGAAIVLQPTSPLRSAASIGRAVAMFSEAGCESLSTAVREPHLYWYDEPDEGVRPLFESRRNRQFMAHRVLRETGAIQIVRADVLLRETSMVGSDHRLFELGGDEAFDIDTIDDYLAVKRRIEQGTVVLRITANRLVGSGHLFHCLRLAEELADQRIQFLLRDCDDFVSERLSDLGYRFTTETDLLSDLISLKGNSEPCLLVNDVLDTDVEDVLSAKRAGFLVVNVEDLGPGAQLADWVVNALYPVDAHSDRVAFGAAYATLRGEFVDLPEKDIRADARRVLLTFGGTDPCELSSRVASVLHDRVPGLEIRVVVGPGAPEPDVPQGVTVTRSLDSMAAAMLEADVVVTSAGRTVYEAAAVGTPVVVLAQNAREATHAHIGYDTGVVFLGVAPLVDDGHIAETVRRLLADVGLRRELADRLHRSIDMRGAERIANRIRSMMQGLVT